MVFLFLRRLRLLSRLLLLALLSATGVSYAIVILLGNVFAMQARSHFQEPPVAIALYTLAGDIFPLSHSFRIVPAHYAIYAQSEGWVSLQETLALIDKALKTNPNSAYLRGHRKRLEGL